MTSTLVDSNVLIDIFQSGSPWFGWSSRQIGAAHDAGPVVINAVIAAEVAGEFSSIDEFEKQVMSPFWLREEIPFLAAYHAGSVHREYRLKGGPRERTLPDFLVGAHAAARGYRLLTRDARRYRTYFHNLDIIAPDTHP
jgi:predicted nucleic acid-binding protein